MNCRQVEEGVFPDPAVAGLLKEHYVEARLHTDDQSNPERSAALEKLQMEMTGSIAQPYYIVIDPKDGSRLGVRKGAASVETFVKFFQKHVDTRRTN